MRRRCAASFPTVAARDAPRCVQPLHARATGAMAGACELNETAVRAGLRALPAFFLRHWPERSVSFAERKLRKHAHYVAFEYTVCTSERTVG